MTGALCIIGPNSAVQPLVAVCLQLTLLCVLLRAAPYKEDIDDYASFISSFSLLMIVLMAFAMYANQHYPEVKALNGETLSTTLMLFTIGSAVVQVILMFPKCFPGTASRLVAACCRRGNKSPTTNGLDEKQSRSRPAELEGAKMQVIEMTTSPLEPNRRLHLRLQMQGGHHRRFSAAKDMTL